MAKFYTAKYTVLVRIKAPDANAAGSIAHGIKASLVAAARIDGKTTAKLDPEGFVAPSEPETKAT
jgi:hypothetical protein